MQQACQMVCCLFSSEPVSRQPREIMGKQQKDHRMLLFMDYQGIFQIGMKEACCKEPACAHLPPCFPLPAPRAARLPG